MGFFSSLFKKKSPVAGIQAPAAAPQALSWRVTRVTPETPSTVSFEVDAAMDFQAGQFVLLRPTPTSAWRAYSFSRGPGQPLRLTVKRVEGGAVSTHLTSKLAVDDLLEVKGPFGHFVLPPSWARAVLVAGGSGVTPFVSMLHAEAARGWPQPITLFDFNRTAAEQILRTELDALVDASKGQLEVVHVLDDASSGPPTVGVFVQHFQRRAGADVVAMCGPQPLMDLVRDAAGQCYPAAVLLEEKFTMSHEGDASAASHQVELFQDGKVKPFPVKEGEHVLAAARKAGFNLSAGCEMGACGVCRVKVVSGAIQVPDDACLSDGEKADGYALVCVGTVKGNCRIEPAP